MKISFCIKALLILCFLCTSIKATAWDKLEKGIHYKKITLNTSEKVHAFKVNPHRVQIKPIFSEKASKLSTLSQKEKALLAINANFFDTNGQALGLVKKDRKVLKPIKTISWWSVFCIRYKTASIIHSKNVRPGYCHQAVQAGPRLVVNGNIPKLKQNYSKKTAIGINKEGHVIMVATQSPLSITKLAELFQKSEAKGGLECRNALNLDGGSSTQLYAKIKDFTLNLTSYMPIPVALGVFSK